MARPSQAELTRLKCKVRANANTPACDTFHTTRKSLFEQILPLRIDA
jgi:hypothetical protein